LKLDADTIVAGLLHDIIEDTDTSVDDIAAQFGRPIAELVDGVTKLGKIEYSTQKEKEAVNFQKFILATTRDVRVLLVKLADRLHNMRTLSFHPRAESRKRIARETLEIYAPLARQIGVYAMATELENRSFGELTPEAKRGIEVRLGEIMSESEYDIRKIKDAISERMLAEGMAGELSGREKQPYSIWRKLERKSISFKDLADVFAFRLIVPDIDSCYRALGIVHTTWRCLPDRFRDFISLPKSNGYRSLHTSFRGPGNRLVELQIRTPDMHEAAERGVAAHWRYKNKSYGFDAVAAAEAGYSADVALTTFAQMLDDGADPEEFLEHAKLELYRDQVFVFTPKGKLIKLPSGATPVDFAYAVHSDLGNSCVGARINGHDRPLRTRLETGDVVEIFSSDKVAPPPNWESMAVTGKARSAIRRIVRTRQHSEWTNLGNKLLDQALARTGIERSGVDLEVAASRLNFKTSTDMIEAIGRKDIYARTVLDALFPGREEPGHSLVDRIRADTETAPLLVGGDDLTEGVTLHFATCCSPLPGDRIVGLLQPDSGVTVHTIDCPMLADAEDEAWVDLKWTALSRRDVVAVTRISVTAANRKGVLAQLCQAVSEAQGNIINIATVRRGHDFFDLVFDIEVEDVRHVMQILGAMRSLSAVDSAERTRG
jgi:RelA/SpoT family (p)ppGpp synthetase